MKIGALIAEFNPFHAGHKYLIDSMRSESEGVIAIISGNFVQRGECALYEKTERAKAAVKNGVDLVLELPAVYALSSAEGFAQGAAKILDKCGIVDNLCFGSECGDINALIRCADILNEESDTFRKILSTHLTEGMSFPAARQASLENLMPEYSILSMPNNILAVEYIRALKKIGSSIIPMTIRRKGSGYNSIQIEDEFPSASGIRKLIKQGKDAQRYMLYNYESEPAFMSHFDIIVASRLKAISREDLCLIPDCNDEIAARLKESSVYNSFEEIIEAASCKRYTKSRLRRILCNMIIGNNFKTLPSPTYIRPLAFNKTGSRILHEMKNTASLPIAARGALLKTDSLFNLECRATDIYNLPFNIRGNKEYNTVVEIID